MSLINCPECKNKVSSEASTCPKCGIKIRDTEAVLKAKQKEPSTAPLAWVLAVFIVLWVLWPSQDSDVESTSSDQRPVVRGQTQAWVICQEFVKAQLRSPSSAEFPWLSPRYVTELNSTTFEVNAYVDADNLFGAALRTDFYCRVSLEGSTDWQLEELRFDEKN